MSTETADPVPTTVLDGAVEDYPRERQYVWVALALGAITMVEIATYAQPHFALWNWGDKAGLITVLMLLMAVKFWTVAYFFMHLKFDKPILTRVFYAGVILAFAVYVAVLTMFKVWYPDGTDAGDAMSLVVAVDQSPVPHWVAHPEVWLLVAGLIGLRLYAGRVIGPKVVPAGTKPFNRRQDLAFIGAVLVLWVASDWPLHEIAEQRLYSAHMFQHLLMTMMMPPLLWLATPEWLARLVIPAGGRAERVLHSVAKPLPALLVFNAFNLLSHWPWIVTEAVTGPGTFHYTVHFVLVFTAMIMWIPVCGPWKELRLTLPGQMVYLFAMSIFPTLPAAMLANSDTVVYTVYDHAPRLWGISVLDDQVAAGLVMKLAEVSYLWVIITVMFFKWAGRHLEADRQGIITVDERELMEGNPVSPL